MSDAHTPFDEAASEKWPDKAFEQSVKDALDTLGRHGHIQVRMPDGDQTPEIHLSEMSLWTSIITIPSAVMLRKTGDWGWDETAEQAFYEHRHNKNANDGYDDKFRQLIVPTLKARYSDYPEVVEAIDVIDQVAAREIEWKAHGRSISTPAEAYAAEIKLKNRFEEKDDVSVPHSSLDDSPAGDLARRTIARPKASNPPWSRPEL